MFQGQTIEILHGDEGFSGFLTNIINRANVRVIQCRRSFGLTLEPFQGTRIMRQIVRQEFQCDWTIKPRVFGLIDHTHPPTAQLVDDAVVGELKPNEGV
jgi:hypothetical protein